MNRHSPRGRDFDLDGEYNGSRRRYILFDIGALVS